MGVKKQWREHYMARSLADPLGHEGVGIMDIINHGSTLRPLLVYIYPRKGPYQRTLFLDNDKLGVQLRSACLQSDSIELKFIQQSNPKLSQPGGANILT